MFGLSSPVPRTMRMRPTKKDSFPPTAPETPIARCPSEMSAAP
jgi:hypothetical protein